MAVWAVQLKEDNHDAAYFRVYFAEKHFFVFLQMEFIDVSQMSFIHDLGPKGL